MVIHRIFPCVLLTPITPSGDSTCQSSSESESEESDDSSEYSSGESGSQSGSESGEEEEEEPEEADDAPDNAPEDNEPPPVPNRDSMMSEFSTVPPVPDVLNDQLISSLLEDDWSKAYEQPATDNREIAF